jgi:hypothetical protein
MPFERRETITTPDRDIEAKMLKNGYIRRSLSRHHVSAPAMGCFASLMSTYANGRSNDVTAITSAKNIARMADIFRRAPGEAMMKAAPLALTHLTLPRNAPAPRLKVGA